MQLFNTGLGSKVAAMTPNHEVDAALFALPTTGDATPALRQLLKAARTTGTRKILLPTGIYHFHAEHAEERYCAISNNDNGLKRSPFPLIGFDDLEIDGQGSEFIFHGFLIPFLIENSRKIVLKNFSIDWAKPFYFQGQVVAVNEVEKSFDLQAHEECDAFVRDNELFFGDGEPKPRRLSLEPVTWTQNLHPNYVFDGDHKHVATEYRDLTFLPPEHRTHPDYQITDLGKGRFRLQGATDPLPAPGAVMVATGSLFPNRHSPAIRVWETNGLTIQDVSIHHAGAMGLIAERSEDITLERFDVCLRKDSPRLVTTVADATHFVYCRGTIRLVDCLFENMLDDATNVHGCYVRVDRSEGTHSVIARIVHHQQFGFSFAAPGETLRFSAMSDLTPYGKAEVKAVKKINEELLQITFTQSIASLLRPDTVLDNLSWQPNVEITGCTVRNNRARSFLLSTGGSVKISQNTFSRSSMSNILMEGDCDYWHESGPSTETVITGNHFIGLSDSHAAIHLSPKSVIPWPVAYHRNIRIEKNIFESASGAIIYARSVEDLVFCENEVQISINPARKPSGAEAAFDLDYCRNVQIKDNHGAHLRIACGPETSEITRDTSRNGATP